MQAAIYKKLAAEVLDQRREMITSEIRSKHIILLTKARECYYLTLDRLRSPGVDAKHPLNAELNSHIEEIESQLSRIDPDVILVGGDGKSFLSYSNVQENLVTVKCHFRKLSELSFLFIKFDTKLKLELYLKHSNS